jgi:hypothetical protein
MVDLSNAWAWAWAVAAAISYEGPPHLTFARASQDMATMVALLDTLPMSSANGVDKVYHKLKDILNIAASQQAESLL